MKLSRRDFLKLSGATVATVSVANLGFDVAQVAAQTKNLRIKNIKPVPTLCPYCGCGCGILTYSENGVLINTEGDPDHPVNQGSLCSKGAALFQLHTSEKRVKKPLYRAPGSDKWEEKDWNWMLDRIAEKVKATRESSFLKTQKVKIKDAVTGLETEREVVVNRTEAIASLGGAALDNEECYLISKLMRSLGVVYLEHQARI